SPRARWVAGARTSRPTSSAGYRRSAGSSWCASATRPSSRGAGQPLRSRSALAQGASAARAGPDLDGRGATLDGQGLEVGLVAAMRADAVHTRRLRVEAADRGLAAQVAGEGHAGTILAVV